MLSWLCSLYNQIYTIQFKAAPTLFNYCLAWVVIIIYTGLCQVFLNCGLYLFRSCHGLCNSITLFSYFLRCQVLQNQQLRMEPAEGRLLFYLRRNIFFLEPSNNTSVGKATYAAFHQKFFIIVFFLRKTKRRKWQYNNQSFIK